MSLAAPHSPDGETRQGSFRADPDDLTALGLPEPRIFAVPANTLVVADTFGFHARGPSAGRSLRVEIWAYGRRSPFVPWAAFDPWTGAADKYHTGDRVKGSVARNGDALPERW